MPSGWIIWLEIKSRVHFRAICGKRHNEAKESSMCVSWSLLQIATSYKHEQQNNNHPVHLSEFIFWMRRVVQRGRGQLSKLLRCMQARFSLPVENKNGLQLKQVEETLWLEPNLHLDWRKHGYPNSPSASINTN